MGGSSESMEDNLEDSFDLLFIGANFVVSWKPEAGISVYPGHICNWVCKENTSFWTRILNSNLHYKLELNYSRIVRENQIRQKSRHTFFGQHRIITSWKVFLAFNSDSHSTSPCTSAWINSAIAGNNEYLEYYFVNIKIFMQLWMLYLLW